MTPFLESVIAMNWFIWASNQEGPERRESLRRELSERLEQIHRKDFSFVAAQN